MNDPADTGQRSRTILRLWLLVTIAVAVMIAANAHLVYVATSSQPECVAHLRQGEGTPSRFSAAQSSCSPVLPSRRSQGDTL
jgi:hypothetical protein